MAKGDHIRVKRGLYYHHGIDCGDGTVVHYNGSPLRRRDAAVARTPVELFSRGGSVEIVQSCPQVHAEDVVRRALSRLGESLYHLVWNNCEHFAWWCVTGEGRSHQVEKVAAGVITVGAAACLALVTLVGRPTTQRLARTSE